MYVFLATHPRDAEDYKQQSREYGVTEYTGEERANFPEAEPGDLVYSYSKLLTKCFDPTAVVLSRCGYALFKTVTSDEAMLITGIDHPMAAMDRLRELVHESSGVA